MTVARAPNRYTLVADIGGTNTRVALAEGTQVVAGTARRYRNAEFAGLEPLLKSFLAAEGGVDCAGACVAAAGPVRNGAAALTNLDWHIDTPTIARAAQAERVAVLNDLEAQGHALDALPEGTLRRVLDGPAPVPGASRLVIGVGTGFNAAPVHETPDRRFVAPSEAGHADLPLRTHADLRLAGYIDARHGFTDVEEVLSGRGLERIHAWLGEEAGEPRSARAADIVASLKAGGDPRAEATAAVFARMLGAVAGNLSLIHLPFGGVYLIGGVARALAPFLGRFGFAEAFRDKGRFSELMAGFAVSVIEDDDAALTGCAAYLARAPHTG